MRPGTFRPRASIHCRIPSCSRPLSRKRVKGTTKPVIDFSDLEARCRRRSPPPKSASALRDGVVGFRRCGLGPIARSLVLGYPADRCALLIGSSQAAIPTLLRGRRLDALRTGMLGDTPPRGLAFGAPSVCMIVLSCSRPRSQGASIRGDHARGQGDSVGQMGSCTSRESRTGRQPIGSVEPGPRSGMP
jgi:hypothetical protein